MRQEIMNEIRDGLMVGMLLFEKADAKDYDEIKTLADTITKSMPKDTPMEIAICALVATTAAFVNAAERGTNEDTGS